MTAVQFGFEEKWDKWVTKPKKMPGPNSVAGKILRHMLALTERNPVTAWQTLWEIQGNTGGAQTAISARLREFRKLGYRVEGRPREGAGHGVVEYRVRP